MQLSHRCFKLYFNGLARLCDSCDSSARVYCWRGAGGALYRRVAMIGMSFWRLWHRGTVATLATVASHCHTIAFANPQLSLNYR